MRNPKLWGILWDKSQNWMGDQKPERKFTRAERGQCKAVYSQRKPFWECMERQIDRGDTKITAVKRVMQVYGHLGSVTKMLIGIRKDEKRGGHNLLNPFSVEERRAGRRQGNQGQ